MSEFGDACQLLSQHLPIPISHDQIMELGRAIDINKDGHITFNEFLETFRLVNAAISSE